MNILTYRLNDDRDAKFLLWTLPLPSRGELTFALHQAGAVPHSLRHGFPHPPELKRRMRTNEHLPEAASPAR
jgi:hypothetical protein